MPTAHARRVARVLEMQDGEERARSVRDAEIEMYDLHETRASGGTYLVVFQDGSCAYHKRHDKLNSVNVYDFGHDRNTPPLHECAAWHFAKALGPRYERLLPVTAYRQIDGEWGSLAAALPGVKPAAGAFTGAPDQVNDAGFFDVLIGQQDRHLNNFLWDVGSGRLGLFDHGFAFPAVGHRHRVRSWQLQRQRRFKQMKITNDEAALIERGLASGDLLGIEPLLESERADEMKRRLWRLLEPPRLIPKAG